MTFSLTFCSLTEDLPDPDQTIFFVYQERTAINKGEAVYEWEDVNGMRWPYKEKPKYIPANELTLKFSIRTNNELIDFGPMSVVALIQSDKLRLHWAAYAKLPETLLLLMEAKKGI